MTGAEARALKPGEPVRWVPSGVIGKVLSVIPSLISINYDGAPAPLHTDPDFMEAYERVSPEALTRSSIVATETQTRAAAPDDTDQRRIKAKQTADDIDKMATAILQQTEVVAGEKATLTQMEDFREKLVNHLISIDRGDHLQMSLLGEGENDFDVEAFLKGIGKKRAAAKSDGGKKKGDDKDEFTDKKPPKWMSATMSDLGILEPMASYLSQAQIHTLGRLKELQQADPFSWYKDIKGIDTVSAKQIDAAVNRYLIENNDEGGFVFLGLMLRAKDAEVGRKVWGDYEETMAGLLKTLHMPPMVGKIGDKHVALAGTKTEHWNKLLAKLAKKDKVGAKKVLRLLDEGRNMDMHFQRLLEQEKKSSAEAAPPLVGGLASKLETGSKPERKAKPEGRPKARN
jgi:hypothetical protein